MRIARRGFLKGLFAAPIAGKAVAKEVVNGSFGINPLTGLSAIADEHMGGPVAIPKHMWEPPTLSTVKSALKKIKRFGLPAATRRSLWKEANQTTYIQPDIACLRSVALSHKRRMSVRERYNILLAQAHDDVWNQYEREKQDKEIKAVLDEYLW